MDFLGSYVKALLRSFRCEETKNMNLDRIGYIEAKLRLIGLIFISIVSIGSMVLPMFFRTMDNKNPYMVPNCSTIPSKIGILISPYRNNTSRA